jgi:hypothetical protein
VVAQAVLVVVIVGGIKGGGNCSLGSRDRQLERRTIAAKEVSRHIIGLER